MRSAIVIATAVASLVEILLSGVALGAPDEALLGKGEGYPVCRLDDAGGAAQGRQIVPAAWVRAMTNADAPHLLERFGPHG